MSQKQNQAQLSNKHINLNDIRKIPELCELSDEEAQQMLRNIQQYCALLTHFFNKTD